MGRVQGSVEVWWCPMGERWLSVPCLRVVDSMREKLFCIVCNLAHPSPSVFFSPMGNGVLAPLDTFLVGRCRGCAPGEAGLDVSVACNVVAQERSQDLFGTANPSSTCYSTLPCGAF